VANLKRLSRIDRNPFDRTLFDVTIRRKTVPMMPLRMDYVDVVQERYPGPSVIEMAMNDPFIKRA